MTDTLVGCDIFNGLKKCVLSTRTAVTTMLYIPSDKFRSNCFIEIIYKINKAVVLFEVFRYRVPHRSGISFPSQ